MKQRIRIIIAVILILIVGGVIITVDILQRRQSSAPEPGSIPILVKGELGGYILPSELAVLDLVNFVDAEEGKKQDGWLLQDVLKSAIDTDKIASDTMITISSSSREKSIELSWAEITDLENKVMFDMANKGTLKLVSEKLPQLDIREEWIQDVDKIEVQ